jgi:hypothetical protein
MSWPRRRRLRGARRTEVWRRGVGAALAAAVAVLALAAPPASALTLVPPKPYTLWGFSDRGSVAEVNEFTDLFNKHPSVLQTFHPWGNSLNKAYERWRETGTRPVLHISTVDDQTLTELITPQQIAMGFGDDYLLQLNDFLSERGVPAYVRPLGEPNRCLNAWSGVECDGTLKDGEHARYWYKQAFRRIVAIVRGGASLEGVNATLAEIGLPPVNRTKGPPPTDLPAAPVAIVWSPLPGGSPRVKGNFPGNYWPGRRWVDWVGSDFYSNYPVWKDLNRFYAGRQWRRMPVALTEWAVAGVDDPRWVHQLVAWMVKRPRVRMFVYYVGFGTSGNEYEPRLYPRSMNMVRRKVRRASFLEYVQPNAGEYPELPPKPKKVPPAPPAPPAPPLP